jgi:hypothetical protein
MRLVCSQFAERALRVAALGVCGVVLAGCQGLAGMQQTAQVRVIDASPDAPALDIAQSVPVPAVPTGLYNVGFGTVSSYMPMTAGKYTHSAYVAGTEQQLALVRGSFAAGGQYTLLAGNVIANLQMAVLKDQSTPAPAGQTAVRFLGQATRMGSVDLYLLPAGARLNGVAPIAAGVGFGANTGYINLPAGTYSVVAYPAGVAPGLGSPSFTGAQTVFPGTSVRTVVVLDQWSGASLSSAGGTRGMQVVTASDYDPS